MIQRFQMSPERRARKLAMMKELARSSFRTERNKENEPPLVNLKMALPFQLSPNFATSTPLKPIPVTDLDDCGPENSVDIETLQSTVICETTVKEVKRSEGSFSRSKHIRRRSNGLRTSSRREFSPKNEKSQEQKMPNMEIHKNEVNHKQTREEQTCLDICKPEPEQNCNSIKAPKQDVCNLEPEPEPEYDSSKFLNEALGNGLYETLDESLPMCVSTSNLLEEIEADLPSSCSLANPLDHTLHTVSGYRTVTRLARMSVSLSESHLNHIVEDENEKETPSKKLERLEVEASVQKALTLQADKAVQFSKRHKAMGMEYVESEKALLLASLRYDVAVKELHRLKMKGFVPEKENYGQLTISDIFFTIDISLGNDLGHFICIAIEKENLLASHVYSQVIEGKIHFKEAFRFQNLSEDFVVCIQLYRLCCKESKQSLLKRTLLEKLKSLAPIIPGKNLCLTNGNNSFSCLGCAELRLKDLVNTEYGKSSIFFTSRPVNPLIGDSITLFAKTGVNMKTKHRGFLNVFKHACWHRRWHRQFGYLLEAWNYPEDQECEKASIDKIFLPSCTSEAKPIGIETCVRPHSFVLTMTDKQILFSADSHTEMLDWINRLNLAIEHFRIWKPDV